MSARTLLALAAPVAVATGWMAARSGRVSVWAASAAAVLPLAGLSLVVGDVRATDEAGVPVAAGIGLVSGAGLYAATVAFLATARGWGALERDARAVYAARGSRSVPQAAFAAVLIGVGEEPVWRGVVQPVAVAAFGPAGGVALSWAAYVGANAVSGSLSIVLGAAVGGAAWTVLAAWSGGVAASLASHAAWTALMVATPPAPLRHR